MFFHKYFKIPVYFISKRALSNGLYLFSLIIKTGTSTGERELRANGVLVIASA